MAPRRGGGGGGGSSSGISCDSDAFSREAPRINIAFQSLFCLVAIILYFIAQSRVSRRKKEGFPLPGKILLILTILFAAFYYIVALVVIALIECSPSSYSDLWPASVTATWLRQLSIYILNVIFLVTIAKKIQNDTGSVQKAVVTYQSAWAGLIAIFLAAALAIETVIFDKANNASDYDDYELIDDLYNPQRALWMVYSVVSVIGILIASVTLIQALRPAQGLPRGQTLTTWSWILIITALGYNLTSLGSYADRAFGYSRYITLDSALELEKKGHAVSFLASFFYSTAFYAALQLLGFRVSGIPQSQGFMQQPGGAGPGPVFSYETRYRGDGR
ncbi:hypothetical protein BDV12DRAFT_126769 [Aspergillus spectabilis]